MHDVVIIGGGHNGLACAGYLAKAGKRVLVLEANPTVGGFVVTNEIPGAPGYLANRFAMEFPFQGIEPSVASELELARFGLEWATPDPHQTHMSEDGTPFSLYHSIDRTCESIARLSRRDAEYYRQWMGALRDVASAAFPYLQGHPTRVHPRTIARIVRRLARHRKSQLPGARALLS
ncbi:MAG: phytoene desaturase family protein, partial [Solirubrobacteraceae bacterium]